MQPLIKATNYAASEKLVKATAINQNVTIEEARKILDGQMAQETTWVNEKYQVMTRTFDHPNLGPCMQINIRRRDGNVIFRDWREFQQIKKQLAVPECEGIELYPAESRKVDASNKYHIFCMLTPDEEHRVPFGWEERDVAEPTPEGEGIRGMRQRPLPASDPESRQHKKQR